MEQRNALQAQAFSLYAVVVGLAIREGLVRVIPRLTLSSDVPPLPPLPSWQQLLYTFRLIVFLTVAIRFFLGAVHYFNSVHFDAQANERYKHKSFGLDFLIGLVHFLFFFAWATTITDPERAHAAGGSHFVGLCVVILLYDLVWLLVCWRYDSAAEIKLWCAINLGTCVLVAVAFFGLHEIFAADAVLREQLSMAIVLLVSLIDIAEIVNGRSYIANGLSFLLSKRSLPQSG
jgi:hypothetical protein